MTPYRSGFCTAYGLLLPAAVPLVAVDVIHTGHSLVSSLTVIALWLTVVLPFGFAVGLVVGAGNATWGEHWLTRFTRRMTADPRVDATATSVGLILLTLAPPLALSIRALAFSCLVSDHACVSPALFGLLVVCLVCAVAVFGIALHRVTRRIAVAIPPIGRLPRLAVLFLVTFSTALAVSCWIVGRRLDYQMRVTPFVMPALVPVIAAVLALLAESYAPWLRNSILWSPKRLAIVLAVATIYTVAVLATPPTQHTKLAVLERSYIGAEVVSLIQSLFDRDGDGYSPFFDGPDCDDTNPDVHPGAREIVGNGIDDNCAAGDANPRTPVRPEPRSSMLHADNVVIVLVDSLRWDRLGSAGYRRDGASLTPHLDVLAHDSVVFRRAYAQAPNTPRSVPSMLASRYPSDIAFDDPHKDYATALDSNDFLFEALAPAGIVTVGETSHFYFCDTAADHTTCPTSSNVRQGAAFWDNSDARSPADSETDTAGPRIIERASLRLRELARTGKHFALFVHLFEPHGLYMPHPPCRPSQSGVAGLEESYDQEIAFEDDVIGQLLDEIDRDNLRGTTAVVVTADHGEAFGEHTFGGQSMYFHGQTLYGELTHVPLLMRVPGAVAADREDVVQLIDVAPTVADLLGVAPPASWEGRSLVPAIAGLTLAARAAFSELLPSPQWEHQAEALVTSDGTGKAIYRVSENLWEFFDLANDPTEQREDAVSEALQQHWREELSRWIDR